MAGSGCPPCRCRSTRRATGGHSVSGNGRGRTRPKRARKSCAGRKWPPAAMAVRGSLGSPRVRRTDRSVGEKSSKQRFIPARAGNRLSVAHAMSCPPVHPRACGEQQHQGDYGNFIGGSSPRVRGTDLNDCCNLNEIRFIAALRTVHPRACGEQTIRRHNDTVDYGSSPRVRGTADAGTGRRASGRFIPARAGNSSPVMVSPDTFTVHPRACGEQIEVAAVDRGERGSSPRVRGIAWR